MFKKKKHNLCRGRKKPGGIPVSHRLRRRSLEGDVNEKWINVPQPG